jgi:hypothetical protein
MRSIGPLPGPKALTTLVSRSQPLTDRVCGTVTDRVRFRGALGGSSADPQSCGARQHRAGARLRPARRQRPAVLGDRRCLAAFGGLHDGGAEHGVGRLKCEEITHYEPVVEIELMRRIKRALDPDNIMYPGKVVRFEP